MSDIKDPIEAIVASALRAAGVRYTHESESKGQGLDFHLPDYGCFVECKAYHTPRTLAQVEGKSVIVVQGKEAANAFSSLTKPQEELVAALKTVRDILAGWPYNKLSVSEMVQNTLEHIEDTLAPYIQEVTHGGGAVESSGNGV